MAKGSGKIYVGIGGWTFEPWRGTFYPADLPKAKEAYDKAEEALAKADDKLEARKKASLTKARDVAKSAYLAAKKAVDEPSEKYTPLKAAVRSRIQASLVSRRAAKSLFVITRVGR